MACAASPKIRHLQDGETQVRRGLPLIMGHFIVLSIIFMILTRLDPDLVNTGFQDIGISHESSPVVPTSKVVSHVIHCGLLPPRRRVRVFRVGKDYVKGLPRCDGIGHDMTHITYSTKGC
jgi:hypothetical protein